MFDNATNVVAFFVLLLATIFSLWWKKRQTHGVSPISARIPLGSQHNLYIVDIAAQRFLVGTGPSAAPQLLTNLTTCSPESVKSPPLHAETVEAREAEVATGRPYARLARISQQGEESIYHGRSR